MTHSPRRLLLAALVLFLSTTAAICEDDGPAPLNCYALSVAECADKPDACEVSVSEPYDDTNTCWATPKQLGCKPKEADCSTALEYTVDADNGCWRHNSNCAARASGHATRGSDPEAVCNIDPRANNPCVPPG